MIPIGAIVLAVSLGLLGVVFATLSVRELLRVPATVRSESQQISTRFSRR